MRSGNGWVTCEQGHQHWGLFGAAGVLAYAPDPEDQAGSLVLLQHRARWSHQGGTWALPGGAMDSDETPAEAALREADEECMLDPKLVVPRGMYSEEHGGWAYHTILAQAAAPFRVYSDAYESDEVEWLPAGQVDRRDLHPGFAASWPVLRAALRPLTVVVDGAGIVTARPGPDGAAGPADAARQLRARLTELTRLGIAALPDGLAVPALARWYPDYVLVLDGAAGAAAADLAPADEAGRAAGTARFSWNEPTGRAGSRGTDSGGRGPRAGRRGARGPGGNHPGAPPRHQRPAWRARPRRGGGRGRGRLDLAARPSPAGGCRGP